MKSSRQFYLISASIALLTLCAVGIMYLSGMTPRYIAAELKSIITGQTAVHVVAKDVDTGEPIAPDRDYVATRGQPFGIAVSAIDGYTPCEEDDVVYYKADRAQKTISLYYRHNDQISIVDRLIEDTWVEPQTAQPPMQSTPTPVSKHDPN